MKTKTFLSLQKALISMILLSLSLFISAQGKTDFSGEWKLNRSKSKLNAEFSMAPTQVILTQKGNSLTSVRTSSFQGETYTQKATYTLDGQDSKNIGFGDSELVSQASWTDDGRSIVIKTTVPMMDGGTMTINETYGMDGGSLTIQNQFEGPWGESSETWVFDK